MKTAQTLKRYLTTVGLAAACSSLLACAESAPGNRAQNSNATSGVANANNASPAQTGNSNEAGDGSPDGFEGTAGTVEKRRDGAAPALLLDVRMAAHPGFDRVVFEFQGDALPGYHVEYVDRPVRQCGSGDPVPVAGDAWLLVRMTPANAHTEAGQPTLKERELNLDLPNLKEMELICDFEADVSWVLGLASPNRYRVLELLDPPRLILDIKQNR